MEVNFLVTIQSQMCLVDCSSFQLISLHFVNHFLCADAQKAAESGNKLKFDVFDRNQAPSAVLLLKGLLPVLYLLYRVQKVKDQGHRSKNRSALLAMS